MSCSVVLRDLISSSARKSFVLSSCISLSLSARALLSPDRDLVIACEMLMEEGLCLSSGPTIYQLNHSLLSKDLISRFDRNISAILVFCNCYLETPV